MKMHSSLDGHHLTLVPVKTGMLRYACVQHTGRRRLCCLRGRCNRSRCPPSRFERCDRYRYVWKTVALASLRGRPPPKLAVASSLEYLQGNASLYARVQMYLAFAPNRLVFRTL